MEYIREMLERQRTVLIRLLGLEREDGQKAAETARTEQVPAGDQGRRDGERGADALWEGALAPAMGEEMFQTPAAREALKQILSWKRTEREKTGMAVPVGGETRPYLSFGQAAPQKKVRYETGVDPTAGLATTEIREVRASGGREADPKILSRAFQRDARRYDGGYRLYE